MYRTIFDSHAHYDDRQFDGDRDALLTRLFDEGVCGIVNCGSDLASSLASLRLAETYPLVYAACGVHPHEASAMGTSDLKEIGSLLSHKKCVAVGEIGLDYHYDFSPRELQKQVFASQLALAVERDLPVIVHDREAHEDTLTLLQEYRPRGVVHCFSGSAEMAAEILKLGMYIGLGGAVTFKNAKKPIQVAAMGPEYRLLIETDCPYMAPVPHRGKRNDSSLIPFTAEVLASVRGTTAQQILDQTAQNAKTLFQII